MLNSFSSWEEFDWSESRTALINILKKIYEFPRDVFLEDNECISEVTNINIEDIKAFKEEISLFMLDEIKSDVSSKRKVLFGIESLDRLLGNGLPSNTIIEIFGSAGSGKTQLCIQLISQLLKTDNETRILFICTQERFPIERLCSFLGPTESFELDRVHIEYFLDSNVELHFFQYSLHEMMREFNYKLIIYDGIASNARSIENVFEKTDHIYQLIASLKKVFLYHEVCIILTNQITEVPSESDSIKSSALGLTLENSVNLKLCVEKTNEINQRRLSIKKSLFSPLSEDYFIISGNGLKGLDNQKL